ncbi:hypothetical protein ASE21_08435 [Flavobacterium sp. Root901]|uniref:hypothetical protein n=1 Tax=Flavobacterium sp. Root901 TaxID=1736605 RepID=UPI00070F4377|nr:hypothetical protein [Flavobacterium sp. Root901]KRD11716.1 hypothetical protein ASE21_08435 [Flavobacterium sp. Root901]
MKILLKTACKGIMTVVLFAAAVSAQAQTGIGTQTPDASAALEISSTTKGLLMPQLTSAQKNTMPTPATGLMIYDTDLNCISVNNGTPAAPSWGCTLLLNRKFFYMPSINIPTSTALIGVTQTKNLYAQYVSEFGTPKLASAGAPASIPYFANPTDLSYYVTYCDTDLIEISGIDANGVMTYKLLKNANYDSYMNIVFAPK